MQNIKDIICLIERSILLDPQNIITSGGIIADGFDEKVDYYREIIKTSHDWLSKYQAQLVSTTGITNLKIKYTNISGYFIEIPKSQVSKMPDIFIHTQTLVGASRFITQELEEFQSKIFDAEQNLSQTEYVIFSSIREQVLQSFSFIKNLSNFIANVDFLSSLGMVAIGHDYVKPFFSNNYELNIIAGRHPVIERIESNFITNDVYFDSQQYVHIITGPNMGGKSTFLRQNAMILLLAHIGAYVPAQKAMISLTDKIFSRVGASDNLYLGQSTFMVEMQEVANILNNATQKSFIIIDEVGRGTSTYDGMSLAWAILKELHDNIKAKTLFATHYHELIDESVELGGVKNFSLLVGETKEGLVFLRKVVLGGIKKSFGLEVAKLAGIKTNVIDEAKKMLKKLEMEHRNVFVSQLQIPEFIQSGTIEYVEKPSLLEEELNKIDINDLTPMEAMNILYTLKNKIHNG